MEIGINNCVYIGDTANAKMTQGLTINQGANDDEILAFKSSDVAHGVTDYTETDTFGSFVKMTGDNGGLKMIGISEGVWAFDFWGIATTDDTTKNAGANAPFFLDASKKSGTGVGAMGSNANLLVIANGGGGNVRFIFDEDGDMFYDGAAPANYDKYDDAIACHDLQRHLYNLKRTPSEQLGDFIQYNKSDLVDMGVVSEGGFVSTKGLVSLQLGAISQLYERNKKLEAKIEALEKRLEA
jgi:hypothetical protein